MNVLVQTYSNQFFEITSKYSSFYIINCAIVPWATIAKFDQYDLADLFCRLGTDPAATI